MTDPTVAALYLIAYGFGIVAIFSVGILFWFWKDVSKSIKLKKFIKRGYIIARLKRIDKTEKEIVVIPNKETNGVCFPGVEGLYTLDHVSVILKDRKFPVYEWREGETAPINYYASADTEIITTKIKCPECTKEIVVKAGRIKSMSPSLLDNLILKIKTLSQALAMNQLVMYLLIGFGVIALITGANAYMTYDMIQHPAKVFGSVIADACKPTLSSLTNITLIK